MTSDDQRRLLAVGRHEGFTCGCRFEGCRRPMPVAGMVSLLNDMHRVYKRWGDSLRRVCPVCGRGFWLDRPSSPTATCSRRCGHAPWR